MKKPGPLRLTPIYLKKTWAAPQLAEPWKSLLNPPAYTGEIWLVSDRYHITKIAEGEHAGLGLDEIINKWPQWILGSTRESRFPFLAKLLNVNQWLSVQVHPNDQIARMNGMLWGKYEVWYILNARKNSQVIIGLCKGTRYSDLIWAIKTNHLVKILARIPVLTGNTFNLCAGTIHAIGPGLIIFELQQSSNLTYRFYDWNRLTSSGTTRQLHIKKALQATNIYELNYLIQPKILTLIPNQIELLANTPYFSLLKCELHTNYNPDKKRETPRLIFLLYGQGKIISPEGMFTSVKLQAGQCWLIPAGLKNLQLIPTNNNSLTILECIG